MFPDDEHLVEALDRDFLGEGPEDDEYDDEDKFDDDFDPIYGMFGDDFVREDDDESEDIHLP